MNTFKLSILICHNPNPTRVDMLTKLMLELYRQIELCGRSGEVEILVNPDPGTIGHKRNQLLDRAWGEYVAFFDDDDFPMGGYIFNIMRGIDQGVDCCSLRGIITFDGGNPQTFEHSIIYNEYKTVEGAEIKYERYPNHLNAIRKDIAIQFKFPETNFGEDTDWATQIHQSGLLKREHYINEPIYHYRYITNKNH